MLLANFCNDLLEPFGNTLYEYLAPILGTPDDMILARVVHIPIRFVRYCTHENSIQHQAIYCQVSTFPRLPSHLKRNAPHIPTAEAEGFTARSDNSTIAIVTYLNEEKSQREFWPKALHVLLASVDLPHEGQLLPMPDFPLL